MEPKNSKIFNKETMQTVSAFCESKGIKDIDNFIYLCFKQGFDIRKYGLLGDNSEKTSGIEEKWVEKEVIVEKRVEIPVEVIKEVEKIVEVIKEIPVDKVIEKEIYITDDKQVNELGGIIADLKNKMSKKDEELAELLDKPPVEVIKEVEKIVEVPVEKIVTKTEYIRDENGENQRNEKIKLLQETLQSLRGELLEKNEQIKELEKINRDLLSGNQNQGYLLRGSNLNRRI